MRSAAALVLLAGCAAAQDEPAAPEPTPEPVSFENARGIGSVFGDIPYSDSEEAQLAAIVAAHNGVDEAAFLVHTGDIKSQGLGLCRESHYTTVAGLLRTSTKPVFILPGDNEWNDCSDPDEAWAWWTASFDAFDAGWDFGPAVTRQAARPENFAFVLDDILFVGINLVGGAVHDEAEWAARHADDADWVDANLAASPNVDAFVLLAHAAPSVDHDDFMARFIPAAAAFDKPVLFVHADGHGWIEDQPWDPAGLHRIQLEAGGVPPLLIGFDDSYDPPFIYDRDRFEVPPAQR